MNAPRLEIFLNEKSELCIAKVEKIDSKARLIFDFDLSELNAEGEDAASQQVGATILGILKVWHKEIFEKLPNFIGSENNRENDYDIAMRLIGQSMSMKTKIHIRSIEFLLLQEAAKAENAKEFLNQSWPNIRSLLEEYPD